MTSLEAPLKIDSGLVMLAFFRRYAHAPLGSVVLLLIVAVIAWLLERRVDGVFDPAVRMAVPPPPAVTIAPGPADPAPSGDPPAASEPVVASAPEPPPAARRTPAAAPVPPEHYVLESGPFTSRGAADGVEDQLNRLGYATIRFRARKPMRLFIVAATGFASVREAHRASAELGRGTVVQTDGVAEVLLDRLPSLGEAIAAARPVRARGFAVRVGEEVGPTAIYHVRYGQFGSRAEAETRAEALALLSVHSRVVKVE